MPHAAELIDVSLSVGGRHILSGVDLTINPGVTALLGPNGAGKTTTIRVLTTLLKPTRGRVVLSGVPVDNYAAVTRVRRQVGYLPQDFGYIPNFTVGEYLQYCAWLKQLPRGSQRAAIASARRRVDLTDTGKKRLKDLSGGMRQRVGIAQAVLGDPPFVVLDEPTVGLDPEQRFLFRQIVREMENAAVLVSTHLTDDVSAMCSRVAVMAEGRVVFDDAVEALSALGRRYPAGLAESVSDLEAGYLAVVRGGLQ